MSVARNLRQGMVVRARTIKCAAAVLFLGATLSGCARLESLNSLIPWRIHDRAPRTTAVQRPVPPPVNREMVQAVGDDFGSDVPVDVRFVLKERPEVGQPAKLDLQLVPSAPLSRLVASYHADSGLTLAAGADPTDEKHPKAGVPINHALTIVAQQDGIFYVNATVLADSASGSIARTFTIPIIAGGGLH